MATVVTFAVAVVVTETMAGAAASRGQG